MFDLDLNFICSIGSRDSGRGKFDHAYDVAFDIAGNMYIAEFGNDRVQVMDSSGQFIRMLSQKGGGKLSHPTALHIADKYVYVSDRIIVLQCMRPLVRMHLIREGCWGRGRVLVLTLYHLLCRWVCVCDQLSSTSRKCNFSHNVHFLSSCY